jgi:uncharacterized membrane protein
MPMNEVSQRPEAAEVEPPLFSATISPHRSLSRRGFNILMAVVGVASFALGVGFLSMGAWPVFGFFGLDAALIYWAFRRNYFDARAYEQINLSRDRLHVKRVTAHGRAREFEFNPYWTRLIVDRRSWGIAALALSSSGKRLAIGGFLSPNERGRFADALSAALAAARSAPAGA